MARFVSRMCAAAIAAVVIHSTAAEGQIVRRPPAPRVVNWGGASIGITQGYTIEDGTTSSSWDFGSGIEYAGRFEHPMQSGLAVGVQASYAKMPLTYRSSAPAGCGSCDATATVTQVMGILHYGRGYSFHPVYELSVGAIGYSSFRRESDPTVKLGPGGTDYDLKFSLGYGLGFGVSSRTSIEVVQELGTVLHQKDGLSGSSSYPRVYVTRLGGKVSF